MGLWIAKAQPINSVHLDQFYTKAHNVLSDCFLKTWSRISKYWDVVRKALLPLDTFYQINDERTYSTHESLALLQAILETISNRPSEHENLCFIVRCGILAKASLKDFIDVVNLVGFKSDKVSVFFDEELIERRTQLTNEQANELFQGLRQLCTQQKEEEEMKLLKDDYNPRYNNSNMMFFFKPLRPNLETIAHRYCRESYLKDKFDKKNEDCLPICLIEKPVISANSPYQDIVFKLPGPN